MTNLEYNEEHGPLAGKKEIDDKDRGLYHKYKVERIKPDPKGKHKDCDYYVLDMTHDTYAKVAIAAYVLECGIEFPELAKDLTERYLT